MKSRLNWKGAYKILYKTAPGKYKLYKDHMEHLAICNDKSQINYVIKKLKKYLSDPIEDEKYHITNTSYVKRQIDKLQNIYLSIDPERKKNIWVITLDVARKLIDNGDQIIWSKEIRVGKDGNCDECETDNYDLDEEYRYDFVNIYHIKNPINNFIYGKVCQCCLDNGDMYNLQDCFAYLDDNKWYIDLNRCSNDKELNKLKCLGVPLNKNGSVSNRKILFRYDCIRTDYKKKDIIIKNVWSKFESNEYEDFGLQSPDLITCIHLDELVFRIAYYRIVEEKSSPYGEKYDPETSMWTRIYQCTQCNPDQIPLNLNDILVYAKDDMSIVNGSVIEIAKPDDFDMLDDDDDDEEFIEPSSKRRKIND